MDNSNNNVRATFTVNMHDKYGDVVKECILLHFGENHILSIANLNELDVIVSDLKAIKKEIKENY